MRNFAGHLGTSQAASVQLLARVTLGDESRHPWICSRRYSHFRLRPAQGWRVLCSTVLAKPRTNSRRCRGEGNRPSCKRPGFGKGQTGSMVRVTPPTVSIHSCPVDGSSFIPKPWKQKQHSSGIGREVSAPPKNLFVNSREPLKLP